MLRAALGAILVIAATPLWAQQLPQAPRPVQTNVALTVGWTLPVALAMIGSNFRSRAMQRLSEIARF